MKSFAIFSLPVLLAVPFLFSNSTSMEIPATPGFLPATADKPATFQIDTTHSWILFKVNHLGMGTAWGSFDKFSGSFELDAEKPSENSVSLAIEANSVSTKDTKRDNHLKGPDFFNAREFPSISFQSTSVKGDADNFTVTGTLELLGKKKEVEVAMQKVGEGKDPWGKYRAGFEGSFTINRGDFGMDYMKEGLGMDITVTLAFEGTRDS